MKFSGARGFTLVELLVAISIVLLLTAVLVPGLRFITDSNRVSEASRLVSGSFHRAASRSAGSTQKKSSGRNGLGENTETKIVSGACIVFERNPNFQQEGVFFGATKIKHGRYQTETRIQEVNREITFFPIASWENFSPPITDGMPKGTEVSINEQDSTIEKFVRSS